MGTRNTSLGKIYMWGRVLMLSMLQVRAQDRPGAAAVCHFSKALPPSIQHMHSLRCQKSGHNEDGFLARRVPTATFFLPTEN